MHERVHVFFMCVCVHERESVSVHMYESVCVGGQVGGCVWAGRWVGVYADRRGRE